jgi:hypothetical protein
MTDDSLTAYCPVCREDVAVTWLAPPYSVAHVLDTDPPVHRHPVTAELVTAGQATIAGWTHIREAKESAT